MIEYVRLFTWVYKLSKSRFIIIVVLSIINLFVDMFGIGSLFAMLSSFTNNDLPMLSFLNNYDDRTLVILFSTIFLIVSIIKYLFGRLNLVYTNKSIASIQSKLCSNYFVELMDLNNYYKQPIHEKLKNIISESNNISGNIVQPTYLVVSEGLLLISFSLIFLYFYPIQVLVLLCNLFFGYIFFKYFNKKNKLSEVGELRSKYDAKRISFVTSSLNNIRHIILNNYQFHSSYAFNLLVKKYFGLLNKTTVLNNLPRIILESLVFLIIIIWVVVGFIITNDLQKVVLSTLFFGVVIVRVLPSLSRILSSFTALSVGLVTFEIFKSFDESKYNFSKKPKTILKSKIKNKFKSIDIEDFVLKREDKVLSNKVDLSIPFGHIILIGESGVGKTSLIDSILGLNKSSEGNIFVNQEPFLKFIGSRNLSIGYVPQEFSSFHDTLEKNISYPFIEPDNERVKEVIESVGLTKLVSSLPNGVKTVIEDDFSTWSGGQKQRLAIARALYSDPVLLVLDEPTSALDDKSESEIINLITSNSKAMVIIISHNKNLIKKFKFVLKMENNKIELFKSKNYEV